MKNGELITLLENRFEKNMNRHPDITWSVVQARLETHAVGLKALEAMEATGGEPDVVRRQGSTGGFIFYDCSEETPAGRRSLCYDQDALQARKKNKPENSAIGMAREMGIEVLTEPQYRALQKLGTFDTKTSSWIKTPENIRKLGGALFCDRRYGTVFVYHNGAASYYGTRGFRGSVSI